MALIIGGITAVAAASYALWRKVHAVTGAEPTETASRIRLGADLIVSVARATSWVARLFSGEVLGPLTTPNQREGQPTPLPTSATARTIPLRIGTRAGDLADADAG